MATTEHARRGPLGVRRPGRFVLLVLALAASALPGCTSGGGVLDFQSNPYDPPSGIQLWGKDDPKDATTLPGAEGSKRTLYDDKARVDLEEAKRLYKAQEYAKAEKIFEKIVKAKKLRQDVQEDAAFYYGECQRLQGNYRDAEANLKVYIRAFPYGKYASQANERLFDIANFWLNATRDEMKEFEKNGGSTFKLASYSPAGWFHFDHDLPFNDTEGHALAILEEVRLNDIRGKLAEKALFYIATVKFFRGDYKEADFFYSQLVEQHPKSDLTEKAMKQSIICKQIANGGTQYDTRLVEKCRKYLEEYQRAYPGKDAEWINKQLVSIHYQQADRDYNIAEFYRRTGHPGSAYFCFELVRRRYPNTEYSRKAETRMNELRSRAEDEQKNARVEPILPNTWMGIEVPSIFSTGPTVVTQENAASALRPGARAADTNSNNIQQTKGP
jgi:outer membrane protein assembly factor BamD (BamD/ComL family)